MNHPKKHPKSLFISFEGGEGAGKTTLIERCFEAFVQKGYSVIKTREPGGTPLGEEVRKILLHKEELHIAPLTELLLFLSSRAQQLNEVIIPALHEGNIVLCDRFNESSIAYQGAGRGLGEDFVEKLCLEVCQKHLPHLTFILNLDPSKGDDRIKKREQDKDRLEKLDRSFHEKIQSAYCHLAEKHPKRIKLIDASMPKEEVFEKVWEEIEKLF